MSAETPEIDLFRKIREEHKRILDKIDELVGSDPEIRHEKINELLMQIMPIWMRRNGRFGLSKYLLMEKYDFLYSE